MVISALRSKNWSIPSWIFTLRISESKHFMINGKVIGGLY